MRSKGHGVYFVAIVGLQALPYLLVALSIAIFNWQLSRSALFFLLLLFHVFRCSSAFGLEFCRRQTELTLQRRGEK